MNLSCFDSSLRALTLPFFNCFVFYCDWWRENDILSNLLCSSFPFSSFILIQTIIHHLFDIIFKLSMEELRFNKVPNSFCVKLVFIQLFEQSLERVAFVMCFNFAKVPLKIEGVVASILQILFTSTKDPVLTGWLHFQNSYF